jgi:hypothetical protein
MNAFWEPVGAPRLPLVAPTEATMRAIKEAMVAIQGT